MKLNYRNKSLSHKLLFPIFILSLFLLFTFGSCKSPTAPKPNNPLDTTSSNFTFQAFTFGNTSAGSSYLNDVAIINDTDIWVVGAIYLTDSTGQPDPFPYNAVHWDGKMWQQLKIAVQTNNGKVISPFYGIFAFSSNDIWISSGVPIHGDGETWTQYNLFDMGVLSQNDGYLTKIYGTSSSNIYFVGTQGTIAFYNGIWQKVESRTTLPIQNIFGNIDLHGLQQILCVASDKYTNEGMKLLQIQNNTVTVLPDSSLPWSLSSVWFTADGKYYIAGDGLFESSSLNSTWTKVYGLPQIYTDDISGQNYNDILVSGSNGTLSHFNGIRWTNYINNPLPYITGRLVSVNIKGNTIVAVGFSGDNAYIIMGKR